MSTIILTKNIRDGIGVKQLIFINEIAAGKCPLRAPTKNNREDAKIAPFNDPNVEHATNRGINHEKYPNILIPNVTATASDESISSTDNTVKYAIFVTR